MAYCRFRVRVNNERVRDLDPSRHLLLDPEWSSGADWRPAMFLNTWTGAAARRAVGNALSKGNKRKKGKKKQHIFNYIEEIWKWKLAISSLRAWRCPKWIHHCRTWSLTSCEAERWMAAVIAKASVMMKTADFSYTSSCWGFCRRNVYGSSGHKLENVKIKLSLRDFQLKVNIRSVTCIRIWVLVGPGQRASRRKSRKRQATCTNVRWVDADGFARHLAECWLWREST